MIIIFAKTIIVQITFPINIEHLTVRNVKNFQNSVFSQNFENNNNNRGNNPLNFETVRSQ